MKNLVLAVGVLGLLGGFVGCGGDDTAPPIGDGGSRSAASGSSSRGGRSPSVGGADGGANDGGGESQGPSVEIISPTHVDQPSGGVLTGPSVEVLCLVKQSSEPGSSPPDPTTVHLELFDASGELVSEKDGTASDRPDQFAADFVLETVPSGRISFRCSASDKSQDALTTSDSVATFVDHGPTITVVTPEADSAHPLKGRLAIEFTVESAPLATGDDGSEVSSVSLSLDDKVVEINEKAGTPGTYQASVFLDDTETYPETPSGALLITATNKRSPEPVTSKVAYDILIDGEGPVITIESPEPQAVVGGNVKLEFTVSDAGSGVDPATVNVTLAPGDQPRFYNAAQGWTRTDKKYTLTFDTKAVEQFAKVQTTVNIRASDTVGNSSANGQSVQLYLDNVPPEVDLDPENIRTKSGTSCSGSYDPVGDASIDDLDGSLGRSAVSRIAFFRAFVYDHTNEIPNQTLFYHSHTDPTQVRLYVQAAPAAAAVKLLVNKNPAEDNTCDDIGAVDDLDFPPDFSALKPLPREGSPWNRNDPGASPLTGNLCQLDEAPTPPKALCGDTSDMWFVPEHQAGKEPIVYVVGTPNPSDPSCAGIDLEFLGKGKPQGWVCMAARAVDNAGNIGISPPLRVCVDDLETDEQPECRIASTIPPTCTDGCIPPPRAGSRIIRLK